jgi:hypothetical protein
VFPIIVVTLVLLFQTAVTLWLWFSKTYLRNEKVAQTQLIWLLPFLGAALVLVMLVDDYRHSV